jgi:NAD(P)-dependent dehydrogenase (short-subunit alcohol dehydrogenase family)
LAAAGASMVVSHLAQEEKALHFVENIEDPSGNTMVVFVVISKEEVGAIFRVIFAAHWIINSLVNNVGLQQEAAITEMIFDQRIRSLSKNLTGQFLSAWEFVRWGVVSALFLGVGKIIRL